MGRYVTLAAGTGRLARYETLSPDFKRRAELEADVYIDAVFGDWDRSGWGTDGLPSDVGIVAELHASGTYVALDAAAIDPSIDPDEAQRWHAQAEQMGVNINGRGFVIGRDGTIQRRISAEHTTGRQVDVVR